jgi:hypothetical protein
MANSNFDPETARRLLGNYTPEPIIRPEPGRRVAVPFAAPSNNSQRASANQNQGGSSHISTTSLPRSASNPTGLTSTAGNANITLTMDQFNSIMQTVEALPRLQERLNRTELELNRWKANRPMIPAPEAAPVAQDFDPVRHNIANVSYLLTT